MRSILAPFVVPLLIDRNGLPSSEYLYEDGTTGPVLERAVRFRLYASPTPVERERITRLAHDYAGGLREFLDLERGCEQARRATLRQVEVGVWPGGRPSAEGDAYAEQNRILDAAWIACSTIEKDGYVAMRSMLDRLLFMATWAALIVDPPPGWATLADREGLDEGVLYAVWHAFLAATESSRAGK